jgi:hypothetical protein
MAISHADHDHPNTPAARAKCRRELDNTHLSYENPMRKLAEQAGVVKPAKMTVVPRKRGDGGVVKGMKAGRTLKRENTRIKAEGDLADMPRMLAYGVRLAWAADLDVVVGDRFNEAERRVVIKADKGEISLVWRESNPEGISKIWVRNYDSSRQFVVDGVQHALEVCAYDSEAWDEFGNLI